MKKTDGDRHSYQNMWKLGKELGFNRDLIDTVTQYLADEMLLEHTTIRGGIGITHYGIKEVKAPILNPDRPTQYFHSVNIINIQNMTGSQIQQGTNSSNQKSSFNVEQIKDIDHLFKN